MKFKPYRPRLVHGLLEDDPDRRLQFCEIMRDQFVGDQVERLDKIIWSDEACFKLSGYVNRHSCVYWADENPNLTIETQLNQPGVTVWGALSSEGVIEPVFLFFFLWKRKCRKLFGNALLAGSATTLFQT